jgi:hypothetical protein
MARDHTTRRAVMPQVTATTLLTTLIQDLSIAVTIANVGLHDDMNPDATMTDAIITDAIGDSGRWGFRECGIPLRNSSNNSLLLGSRPSLLIS